MHKSFHTSCNKENLKDIRSFVSTTLDIWQVDTKIAAEIVLATDEASANAIIHGCNCEDDKEINIQMQLKGTKLAIKVIDTGESEFDADSYDSKPLEVLVKEKVSGGMGLKLIYTYMDKVDFYKIADKNVCVLQRDIQP